ncbi:MAG: 50S ribosomal protein L19 [Myxococcales bacterium]|nr:50S ribosomal protein L19 [Myxococcales bacterium]
MPSSALEFIQSRNMRKDLTDFRTGDTVRVHWKVKEGDKERVQPFEGIVIRKTKGKNTATFTVRKVSYGVGVERIFPLHSPRYEKIEVISKGSVSRNRLFYLRNLRGKASRVETQEEGEGAGPEAQSAPASEAQAAAAQPAAEAAAAEKPAAEKPAGEKPAKKAKKK